MTAYGRHMLAHWRLDPACTYLNHGTVGAPPARVLAAQQAIRDAIERQPARFMLRELSGSLPAPWRAQTRIREAAEVVAAFVGANEAEFAFTPNVTVAINAVLHSLPLEAGDEILVSDLAYGAVGIAARVAADAHGARARVLELPFPVRDPAQVVDAVRAGLGPRTRLAIVDHITAQSALVMPVADIVAVCQRQGVPVLVDGAHAPGSIPLDVPALGADWYAANLHKWAHAPRSCGFLWARPDRQAGLHHPVTSWGHGRGFREEFEWSGTLDPSPALAAPEGIAALRDFGWPDAAAYMHALAWQAAGCLTEAWDTTIAAPREMIGAMATVPLPAAAGASDADAERLRLALLVEDGIEVQLHASRGRLWVRVSAQIYNDLDDVQRLADAVARRTPRRPG
ncbi:MAG: aminotransferase class V-fold PLP-dependent enzyme [Vicinamibacterales bacterium]